MDPIWLAVPAVFVAGAVLAAVAARRVRGEAAALAAEVVALGSLADEATAVRTDAEAIAARTATEPAPGPR